MKHILIIEQIAEKRLLFLSHEILSYYACACGKDDVWTTGNCRNVLLGMYHVLLISTYVDSCDVKTAVLINLVPRECIKLLFLHHFGNPIADFSNLANCLSSSSRRLSLMFKLAHSNDNTGCKAVFKMCFSVLAFTPFLQIQHPVDHKNTPYSPNSCVHLWWHVIR